MQSSFKLWKYSYTFQRIRKSMVKKQVKTYAFSHLTEKCNSNKIMHMAFKIETFQPAAYLAIITTRCCQDNFEGKVTYAWFESDFQEEIWI